MTATEERWRAQVAAWARSGLSCKAFAAKVGVHPGTLAGWKSKLGRHQAAVQDPSVSFVEVTQRLAVEAEIEAGVIELVVGRTQLRVRGRVEAEALRRVLDVLETRV